MRVKAVQGTDSTGAQTTAAVAGQGEDFSSYLKTTASLEEIFTEAAEKYNVPKNLIKAIAKAESDFNPNATSGAGAQGIMQLMPATARELGVTDSYDPYQNIMGGTKYISEMLAKYDGNVSLALAAYNAGSNNVAKYGGIPPFKETQNYVVKVTGFMNNGVDVPNASYSINADGSISAASVQEVEDSYYQSILEQLFSYEEYLKFIDMYMKLQEAQQEEIKEEQKQELLEEASLEELSEEFCGAVYEMEPEDLEQLKKKHRSDEMREIMDADMKYLRAVFQKLEKERQSLSSGIKNFAAEIPSGVSLEISGLEMPVEVQPVPVETAGASIDVMA